MKNIRVLKDDYFTKQEREHLKGTIVIPDNVAIVDEEIFFFCPHLKKLVFGSGVRSISNNVCFNCQELQSIEIRSKKPNISKWAFDFCKNVKEVKFTEHTLDEIKLLPNYPWHFVGTSIFKAGKK